MKRMEVLSIFVALAVMAIATTAVAGTLDDVKKRGELIAGVRFDMPPFGQADQAGNVQGVDIEIVKHIAAKLGVKPKFQQVTGQTRIPMLVNGNVDLIAAGLAKTEERTKVIDFSSIYIESGTLFLVKKGSPIKSYRDMKGKTVATIQGTIYLARLKEKLPDVNSVTFQEYPQAVLAVEQGKADSLMADDGTLINLIKDRRDKLDLVGNVRDFEAYFVGLGIRKGDDEWLKYLNGVLRDMWKSGELKKIGTSHGFNYEPGFKID